MKKKILCAVLGVLMLFALVACGTGSGDGETTTVPSTSAPAGEITTDGQDNPTPTERTAVNLAVLAGPTGMGRVLPHGAERSRRIQERIHRDGGDRPRSGDGGSDQRLS